MNLTVTKPMSISQRLYLAISSYINGPACMSYIKLGFPLSWFRIRNDIGDKVWSMKITTSKYNELRRKSGTDFLRYFATWRQKSKCDL